MDVSSLGKSTFGSWAFFFPFFAVDVGGLKISSSTTADVRELVGVFGVWGALRAEGWLCEKQTKQGKVRAREVPLD